MSARPTLLGSLAGALLALAAAASAQESPATPPQAEPSAAPAQDGAPAPAAPAQEGTAAPAAPAQEGVAAPAAPAQEGAAAPAPEQEAPEAAPAPPAAPPLPPDPLRRPADLAERIARDARLAFPARAAERAREDLEGGGLARARQRAVALVALGASGSVAGVARIEASAAAGPLEERTAALFALGELGARGERALGRIPQPTPGDATPAAAEQPSAGGDAGSAPGSAAPPPPDGAAPAPEDNLTGAYALALALARGATPDSLATWPDPALATSFLDLRFEAAKRYGFVDGMRWQDWRTDELLGQPLFRLRTVLGAVDLLDRSKAEDQLLELLLEGDAPERVAPIVAFMPEVVSDLVTTGRWVPRDVDEWRVLLGAIEDARLERRTVDLLLLASGDAQLREQALPMLVAAGEAVPEPWLLAALHAEDEAKAVRVIDALGEGGDQEHRADLWSLATEGARPAVTAAALVALVRMGDESSARTLEERLSSGAGEARDETIRAVARAAHDPRMRSVLVDLVAKTKLSKDLMGDVDVALARTGTPRDLDVVRTWLGPGFPVAVRRVAIRAISAHPGESDLALFHQVFPLDDQPDLNVELAIALIRHRDPIARTILRRILWKGDWNVSLLAGGLLLGGGGPYGLQDEVEAPPRDAGPQDRRRVGFALGVWGGMEVVEVLARRRNEGDPILQGAYLGVLSERPRQER